MPLLANDPHLGADAAQRVASGRTQVPHRHRPTARSMSRASASRACRASSSATTTASPGASRTSRPTSPTCTSRRSQGDSVLARRRARAARRAHRDHQGRRRRRCASSTIRSTVQRSDPLGAHAMTSRRSPPTRTPAPTASVTSPAGAPEGDYAVSLKWTRSAAGHDGGSHLRAERGAGLRRLPGRGAAVRRAGAEPASTPTSTATSAIRRPASCRSAAPATGRCRSPAGIRRTTGRDSSRSTSCPTSFNPHEGYIVTANNAIVDESYPVLPHARLGLRLARGAHRRSARSARSAMGQLTADDMRDIQADNEFCDGQATWPRRTWTSRPAAQGPDAALDLLRSWDAQNTADSDAAAYANVLWDELVHGPLRERSRAPGPGHGPGSPVPRRRRAAG